MESRINLDLVLKFLPISKIPVTWNEQTQQHESGSTVYRLCGWLVGWMDSVK